MAVFRRRRDAMEIRWRLRRSPHESESTTGRHVVVCARGALVAISANAETTMRTRRMNNLP